MRTESKSPGRARLLAAASRLFATTGLGEVTVSQILEHSGLKAPTLYHHFGGKERLYVAWVSQALGQAKGELSGAAQSNGSLKDTLTRFASTLIDQPFDLLQILRDRRCLADPGSEALVHECIGSCVIAPLADALGRTSKVEDPTATAKMFVMMIASGGESYSCKECRGTPVSATVSLFLEGVSRNGSFEQARA